MEPAQPWLAPIAGPPPLPPNVPPPLPPEEFDFSPMRLWNLARGQWQTNPIVHRLWRKVRPYALILVLLQVITGGTAILVLLFSQGGAGPAASMVSTIGLSCFGLVMLAVQLVAPVRYADWSYRKTWTNDDMLRLALLSRTERLTGILLPALMTIALFFLPTIVATPATLLVQHYSMPPQMRFVFGVGPISTLLFASAGITQQLLGLASYAMLFSTVLMRRLIQRPAPDVNSGKGFGYLIVPYVVATVGYLIWSSVRGCLIALGPMWVVMSQTFMAGPTGAATPAMPAMPAFQVPPWYDALSIFMSLLAIVLDGLFVAAMFAIYRSMWRGDIPLAKAWLFDASRFDSAPPIPVDQGGVSDGV